MCLFLKCIFLFILFIIGKIGIGGRSGNQIRRKHRPRKWNLSKIWAVWEMWSLHHCPPPIPHPLCRLLRNGSKRKENSIINQVFLRQSRTVEWYGHLGNHSNAWELTCNSPKHFNVRINSGVVCFSLTRLVAEVVLRFTNRQAFVALRLLVYTWKKSKS